MRGIIAVLSTLFACACATPVQDYAEVGPKNLKVSLTAPSRILSSDTLTLFVGEHVSDCEVRVLGQAKVSADQPADLALRSERQFSIGIMAATRGLLESSFQSDVAEVFVKPGASYELVYTLEKDASGYELFETLRGKRVSLPLTAKACKGQIRQANRT